MASNYIQITNLTPRASELLAIINQTADTSTKLQTLLRTMTAILGPEMDYARLALIYGVSVADAQAMYSMLQAIAITFSDLSSIANFTTNIGQ
jgi:hypothetical protein